MKREKVVTDVRKAARRYCKKGFATVPAPPGQKTPTIRKWPELRISQGDVDDYFESDSNIGILLGEPSGGLVDIDLDCREARKLAPIFLPSTGLISGRKSAPKSHWWFVSDGAQTQKFQDVNGSMLVELRSTGGQTIVPPSIHPSGQRIKWYGNADPAVVDSKDLVDDVSCLAAATLLARHWPAKGGRNDCALATAGCLLRGGLDIEQTAAIIGGAARAAEDEEFQERANVVHSTADRLKAGDTATGGPTLEDLIGTKVVNKLRKWLGLRQAGNTMQGSPNKKKTAVDLILDLTGDLQLFHTSGEREAFVTAPINGHLETYQIQSEVFHEWIGATFWSRYRSAPTKNSLDQALSSLAARAKFEGPAEKVHVRLGRNGKNIILDLGQPDWRVVEITPTGWGILDSSPIKFWRPSGLMDLPIPERGGKLSELRRFVNLQKKGDIVLLYAWLMAAMRPEGPYPILSIFGIHGSAKSTACRVLRSLVDPNDTPLRSLPGKEQDLMISGTKSWVLLFDNISWIRSNLSDALCRLSTGGGFATRQLYTDAEEKRIFATRPIILNGIEELSSRPDLLDRMVVLELVEIEDSQRMSEKKFYEEFEKAQPRILGAMLDTVSTALRNLPEVNVPALPRMGDFAEWTIACESCFGFKPGLFMRAYARNRDRVNELAIQSSAIGPTLMRLMKKRKKIGHWKGTAARLLETLESMAKKRTLDRDDWPRTPRALANAVRRLQPSLKTVGIKVSKARAKTRARERIIRIEWMDTKTK